MGVSDALENSKAKTVPITEKDGARFRPTRRGVEWRGTNRDIHSIELDQLYGGCFIGAETESKRELESNVFQARGEGSPCGDSPS